MVGCDACPFGGTVLTTLGKPLVGVVLAGEAVDAVRSRFGGDDGLDGTGATIVDGVGVGLDGCFLNGVGVGGEIDNTGADARGDIESIDDVLIGV